MSGIEDRIRDAARRAAEQDPPLTEQETARLGVLFALTLRYQQPEPDRAA